MYIFLYACVCCCPSIFCIRKYEQSHGVSKPCSDDEGVRASQPSYTDWEVWLRHAQRAEGLRFRMSFLVCFRFSGQVFIETGFLNYIRARLWGS